MHFTVIICTYNRKHRIPECIHHLEAQQGTEGLEWEVLVVDNNSTDGTAALVSEVGIKASIKVRCALEISQGLGHARNRGIGESCSPYYAFIDDDIYVSPGWVKAIYGALQSHDADAVGGRIYLNSSVKLPPWIRPEMRGFLGFQDYGDNPFQMDGEIRYPFGGNMAFNRRVVERIGWFNPNLGRKGEGRSLSELRKGCETDYMKRLAASGGRIFYEPAAVVYHQVLPFQIRKGYFLAIHYNQGFQEAYFENKRYDRTLLGVPVFVFRQTINSAIRYCCRVLAQGPDLAFRERMTVAYFLGRIGGFLKRGRAARNGPDRDNVR